MQAERLRNEAIMFDSFLKSTDMEAAEAIKLADKEAKIRMEKVNSRCLRFQLCALQAYV